MSIQRDSDSNINQIVQQYFSKAAQIIVQSRITKVSSVGSKGVPKLNKWFNIQLEDLEPYKEELRLWRTLDYQSPTIPRLVVETFLDHKRLPDDRDLELIDLAGKTWTVNNKSKRKEIVLERWIIDFDSHSCSVANDELPTIYKNVMILMRSLYTYTRLMPSWTLKRKLSSSSLSSSSPLLCLGCSIVNASNGISSKGRIGLSKSIKDDMSSELESFVFGSVTTHIGSFQLSVTYRTECDFIAKLPEVDAQVFPLDLQTTSKPSTGGATAIVRRSSASSYNPGQLPSPTKSSVEGSSYMASRHNVYKNHTKNNSSDFSATDNASPLSNLNVPYIHSNNNNSNNTPTSEHSLNRRLSVSFKDKEHNPPESSGNSNINISSSSPISTKPSVYFQPFKTPSLSASPSSEPFVSSTSTGNSKPMPVARTTSNGSLAALRIPNRSTSNASATTSVGSHAKSQSVGITGGLGSAYQNPSENALFSTSASSSKSGSVSRFSSSFGSRTGQWTRSGSVSGTGPKHSSFSGDPSSLGSAAISSASSSLDPGSVFLFNDGDGLDSFVKTLDAIGNPKQFNNSSSILLKTGGSSGSSSSNNSLSLFNKSVLSNSKHVGAGSNSNISTGSGAPGNYIEDDKLSRFRNVKDSYIALSDSMHSSQMLKNMDYSSGGATNPFSFPMSSPSIQKSGSAHTPSIPSRLSEGYTADDAYQPRYYSHPRKQESRSSLTHDDDSVLGTSQEGAHDECTVSTSAMTHALDIPNMHTTRVQHRESLSFNNRNSSQTLETRGFHNLSDTSPHHHSLDQVGYIFPGKELTSFRTSAPFADNDNYSRRLSETGSTSTTSFSRSNRRDQDTDGMTLHFRGIDFGGNGGRGYDEGKNTRGTTFDRNNYHLPTTDHQASHAIAIESRRGISLANSPSSRRMSLDNDLVQSSSTPGRSVSRFSYYHRDIDDDEDTYDTRHRDDDEYDDHRRGKLRSNTPDLSESSLVPFDEYGFLVFDINEVEYVDNGQQDGLSCTSRHANTSTDGNSDKKNATEGTTRSDRNVNE